MKKIMFSDKYGLTDAVLQGRKTMMRRLVGKRMTDDDIKAYLKGYTELANKAAPYKIGEVVAVAQAYKSIPTFDDPRFIYITPKHKGWTNKMFVRPELMPHQIKITDIKVERLQDISDEDIMKEGITYIAGGGYGVRFGGNYNVFALNPIVAFAVLIDKVSGNGTWESNPWVFAYSFELCK